jgi:hypothetical protein
MGGRRVWAELRIAGRELKAEYTFSFPQSCVATAAIVWMRDVLGMSDDVKGLRQDARMERRIVSGVGPRGHCIQALTRDRLGAYFLSICRRMATSGWASPLLL